MPLTQVLNDLGVEFRENGQSPHVSPGWLGLICPWCGRNTGNYGLGVNLSSYACNCWKCGSHSLAEALHEITGLGYAELRSRLGEAPETAFATRTRPRGILVEPEGICDLMPCHLDYLRERGFDDGKITNLVNIWKIRGIGLSTRVTGAVYLPVEFGGQVVTWTARKIRPSGHHDRYHNARDEESIVPIKDTLYGIDFVRHAAIIVEGPFDAVRVGPGAVCVFGLSYTERQLAKISCIPVRYICFDNSPEAQSRAKKMANDLMAFDGMTYVLQIDAKDPGDATDEEIKLIRKTCLDD
jgi:hypothetical protein